MAYSDRFPIVKNFFETQLVVACDAGATELHLADIENLPILLVGRDYIPLVVRKATGSREIVYVESVDAGSGIVRVQRGQEGTLATSWDVGAYVYCAVTAESFQRMRVNGFAPLVDPDGGRPAITRTSATAISITGDFSSQIEVGMAVRILSGNAVVVPSDATLGAIFVGSVSYSGGKTLVGLQNVSLPSTVSGLDLGISVASAPLYHPDTPLGDGETITMEGGLLKITDKFKQAQTTRDAAQDAAISAAQSSAASLAGKVKSLAEEIADVAQNPKEIIVRYEHTETITLDGDSGKSWYTSSPQYPSIEGYTPSFIISGAGNGQIGLLVSPALYANSCWLYNTNPNKRTWTGITFYVRYVKA